MGYSALTGQYVADAAEAAAAAALGTTVGGSTGATSPQYAVVYDLISEGEIHGLVNGAASVYLNGTPLTTEAYTPSVSSIISGNGTFTANSLTVSSSQVNLSNTSGRIIILERGGKTSSAFTANAGDVRIRANGFFTANMAINPALLAAARPKLRITGMGRNGGEYVGTVTQYIDANIAVVEPAISTTGTNKIGGIDHIAVVNTATSNSLTVYVAPSVSGTKFQIFSAGIPQDQLYNDKWNFKNTAVNFRVGTLNQTPVTYADVPTASFLTALQESLEWTNTFNGLQSPLSYSAAALGVPTPSEIDKIKLGIEFPAGLYTNSGESQKIQPMFVGFQVKFQYTQGGQVKTAIIVGPSSSTGIPSGKQTGKTWRNAISGYTGYYEVEVTSSFLHEIEILTEQFKPFTNFSIIISRLNPHNSDDYDTDDATRISTTSVKYIESQVLDKFRYPYSAYAAITFPSEGFNSIPGRSYHVRGIKVQVPSNYTTREESFDGKAKYNGTWDGTFITRYTNNPAWIFYDLATNKRYGLGKYVDPSLVDKYSLYRIGRYCDELVPDGRGGMEPRFTCNVYIFEAEEAYKVLRDLATTFRGMMIWAQGALLAIQDSPKEPIYTFTQGNVVDGLFTYEYSGRLARYNEVNINWNNPDQFYQQDVLTVTDQTDIIKQGKVVSMNSVAFGCTSQGQAYRVALWNMLTSQLETEFISFGTGMNANFLLPGDIVNVQDHHLNAVQASGRIRSASGTTITLDRDVTIASSTFNNRTSFENALVTSGTDNFNSFVGNTGAKAASITRSSTNTASLGIYSYRANSTTGTLFIDSMEEYTASEYSSAIANTSNNVGLSTSTSRAGIVLSQFSPAISSLGMNISVETLANTTSEDYNVRGIATYRTFNAEVPLTVNVGYASGLVKSYNIVAGKDKFFGFSTSLSTNISNVSISFTSNVSSTNEFITIDNLILGNTSAAIQSTAHALHIVFDGPGCYLQQASAVISGTTYYRGDLIPGITTSVAATNLLDDSGNVVTTIFSEHTHVQKRSITTPEPYVGNIIEVSSAFTSTPNVESIWAIENATYDNNVAPKKYRILSVKEEQGGVYSVVGSSYAAQKFDELESKVQIRDTTFNGPRPGQDIPNISDLTANYFRMDVDDEDNLSDSVLYAYVSWTPPVESFTDSNGNTSTRQYRYVDAYEIQHNFYDDINTSFRDFITETASGNRNNLVLGGVRPGTYVIRVRTKNIFGQYSSWYSIEITFNRASAAPGYDIFGIKAGGSIDSAVVFEANTFTVIDDYYTFLNPLGQAYTVNAATSAQSSQSFQSLAANSTYFLMWDASDSTDPWKAIKYYYDTSIRTPYGSGNSYWSEAGASSNGLIQLPGTISATIGSRTVTGIGTYFTSNLSPGNLIKLQSSNNANSFYAVVAGISTNTSLTTREVILKSFNAQTIHTPSLQIDYINDTIFSKIIKNGSNIASEDIRYATSAIDEPQLLVLDADSNGFRYLSAGGLIGPSVINLTVNRQNLRGATDWYIYDANNNLLSNTLLNAKTNTSAQINSTSFGSVTNNSFVKITTNVGSLSSSYTVLKVLDGANGVNGIVGRGGHTVQLINENHSIPLDVNGLNGIYTASGTDILVWEGNTPLTYNATATNSLTFNVAVASNTNISVNTNPITTTTTVTNDTRRYGNHSNITANTASIVYAIGVKDGLGSFITYYIQQSFTGLRAGADAKYFKVISTEYDYTTNGAISGIFVNGTEVGGAVLGRGHTLLVYNTATNTIVTGPTQYDTYATGTSALVTAINAVSSGHIVLLASQDATACDANLRTALQSCGARLTSTWGPSRIAHAFIGQKGKDLGTAYESTGSGLSVDSVQTQIAYFTESGITLNGTIARPAHTVLLVNENHSIPLDVNGLNGIYTASGTDILVWEGNTPLTYNATAANSLTFNVAVSSNTNINVNTNPTTTTTDVTNDTRRYGDHSNLTSNTATIIYNITVKDSLGSLTRYTKQQSFSGVRTGATGATGANGANGTIGANGAPAVSLFLSRAGITLFAYAEGTIASYSGASGQASLYSGSTNITENATWTSTSTTGLTGSVSNTSGSKGQYSVTNLATANDTGTLTINALYAGQTYTGQFSIAKAKGGYEIVSGSLPSTNLFEGRVVFFTGDDKLYRYNGSAWTSAVPAVDIDGELLSAQIANNAITTAKLVNNAITQVKIATDAVGAAQVQVNAITVPKLSVIPPGSALNADPGMQDSTAWSSYNGSATFTTIGDGKVGNYVARSTSSGGISSMAWMNEVRQIPVDADKTYRVRAWMRTVSGSGNTAYMGVALFSNTGTNISGDGSQWYYAASGITPPAAWTEYVGTFGANTAKTFPSNARTMSPLFILSYSGGSSVVHEIQDLRIEEVIPSTLIRDDSITTPKLTANSITAAKISTDAIETRHLTANSIVAENLAANSIITRHLAANSVTAVAIAANSIVAGDIAANAVTAGSIAANAILAGNISANAVLAGTISANAVLAYNLSANSITAGAIAANSITSDKINVGAITAAKISTANAVITDTIQIANGIINNAKIIDLSADKLNAGSINITTVGIQGTSATNFSIKSNTSGERLEMSTTTIRIYDSSGTLRVKIGNLA